MASISIYCERPRFTLRLHAEEEDAIQEGRRAVELEPESQDAFHGAVSAANLPLVYAFVGEAGKAVTLIERLLSTLGPVWCPESSQTSRWPTCVSIGSGTRYEARAFPENSRRTGAQDDLSGATRSARAAARSDLK